MASLKNIFVTGGNNGIGYETVKAFLQSAQPYHVLMGSRSMEKASLAIETLHQECPDSANTVEAVQVDLTSDESIEKAFEQVKTSPGHIDALINNAGMSLSLSMLKVPNSSQARRSTSKSSPGARPSANLSPSRTTSTSPARTS